MFSTELRPRPALRSSSLISLFLLLVIDIYGPGIRLVGVLLLPLARNSLWRAGAFLVFLTLLFILFFHVNLLLQTRK